MMVELIGLKLALLTRGMGRLGSVVLGCGRALVMGVCLAVMPVEGALEWTNASGDGMWNRTSINWRSEEGACAYEDGTGVVFRDAGAGFVLVREQVDPGLVMVEVGADASYTWSGLGGVTGDGMLVKSGEGMLEILMRNGYTGGTAIVGGTLIAGQSTALGSGKVWLRAGVLSLEGCGLSNEIEASGGELRGAWNYAGEMLVVGDVLLEGELRAGALVLESGCLAGGCVVDTPVELRGGELAVEVSGSSSLRIEGDVCMGSANDYAGGTTVLSGYVSVLDAGALGSGEVLLGGGTLDLGNLAVDNEIRVVGGAELVQAGAYTGTLVLEGGTLRLVGDMGGELVLNGGVLDVSENGWGGAVGSLSTGSVVTQVYAGALDECLTGRSYTLMEIGTGAVDVGLLELLGADDGRSYVLGVQGDCLVLTVQFREAADLVWDVSQERWGVREAGDAWLAEVEDALFMDGDTVLFDCSDAVEIVGEVRPEMVRVEGAADVTLWGEGSIMGTGCLVKLGEGTLTVEGAHGFSGGAVLEDGVLLVRDAAALGTGVIRVRGGLLDLGGMAVENAVVATGGMLSGMGDYRGAVSVAGDVTLAGDVRADALLVESGVLRGWRLQDVAITAQGGCVESVIGGCSSVTVQGDVTLLGENVYTGTTAVESGCLTVGRVGALGSGEVRLLGGVLDMAGLAVENEVCALGGVLRGAGAYAGVLVVEGELEVHGALRAQRVELQGGSLVGGSVVDTELLARAGEVASCVAGSSCVVVSGEVCLSGDNSYDGGTVVSSGLLSLGGERALGTGDVVLHGGELDLGGWAVENDLVADGGFVMGGEAYAGVLTVTGGVVGVGEGFTARQIVLEDGILAGEGIVDAEVLVEGGRLEAALMGSSSVCVMGDAVLCGSGDYEGGTWLVAGTLRVGAADALGSGCVTVQAGTLDLADEMVLNRLVLQGGCLTGAGRYRGEMVVEGDVVLQGDAVALAVELRGGTLSGGSLSHAEVKALGGVLETTLGSGCRLTVAGDVCLAGANTLTQDVVLESGTLTVGDVHCLGEGRLVARAGVVEFHGLGVANDVVVEGAVSMTGAQACTGTLWVQEGATLHLTGDWNAGLVLNGGTLDVSANGFETCVGSLCTGALESVLDVGDLSGMLPGGSYTLLELGKGSELDVTRLEVLGTECLPGYELALVGNELVLRVDARMDVELVWDPKGMVWGEGMQGDVWADGEAGGYFMQGNAVVFDASDEVELVGVVRPSSLRVIGGGELVFMGDGCIGGTGVVVMEGDGVLEMLTANSYSGGTTVLSGVLRVGHEAALGTGVVRLLGGRLDMGGVAVGNGVVVAGEVEVLGSALYQGELVLDDGVLRGDRVQLMQDAELRRGVVESVLCGSAGVVKTTEGTVTLASANAYRGATRVLEGTLVVEDVAALGSGEVEVGAQEVPVGDWGCVAVLDASGLPLMNHVTLRQGAVLRHGSDVVRVTVAHGASVTLEDYALQRGCTLMAEGSNTIGGALCFAGGTLTLGGTGLVLTGECCVELGSTTVLDVSALAGEFNLEGSHTLLVCEQGITGVTGTAFEISGLDPSFEKELVYDAASGALVLVTSGSQQLPPALDPCYYAVAPGLLNPNQRALYEQLRLLARTDHGGAVLGGLARQVTDETDVATVRSMLDQLGGFSLASLLRGRVDGDLAHLRRVRQAMGAEAAPVNGSGSILAYVNSFANWERRDDVVEAPGYSCGEYGAMLGVEWRASEAWLWGVALEEGVSTLTSAELLEAQTASTTLDLCVSVRGTRWRSSSVLGVSFSESDVERGGLDGVAAANGVDTLAFHVAQELSYDLPLWEGSCLQPYAAVDAGYYRMDGFEESGLGDLSLRVAKQEAWAVDVSLGLRWCCSFSLGRRVPRVALTAHAGVIFGLGDGGDRLRLCLLGAPDYAYSVEGQRREWVGATAGVDIRVPVGRRSEFYVSAAAVKREEGEQLDVRVGGSRLF